MPITATCTLRCPTLNSATCPSETAFGPTTSLAALVLLRFLWQKRACATQGSPLDYSIRRTRCLGNGITNSTPPAAHSPQPAPEVSQGRSVSVSGMARVTSGEDDDDEQASVSRSFPCLPACSSAATAQSYTATTLEARLQVASVVPYLSSGPLPLPLLPPASRLRPPSSPRSASTSHDAGALLILSSPPTP